MTQSPRLILLLLLFAVPPALAQEAAVKVFYRFPRETGDDTQVDQVMRIVLAEPGIVLQKKIDPTVLVLSAPDPVRRASGASGTFSFTLMFVRDSDALGQSEETCTPAQLADCAPQIMTDITSAAAIHR